MRVLQREIWVLWGCMQIVAGSVIPGPAWGREPSAPTSLPDPDTQAARRHYDLGTALYDQQRYAEALREFNTAKQLKPLPAFEYNVARCYERLESWGEAAEAYERFLRSLPAGAEANETRLRIATLRARARDLAKPSPQPAPPSGPSPPSPAPVPSAVGAEPPGSEALRAGPPDATAIPRSAAGAQSSAESPPLFKRHRVATWIVGGTGVALLGGALIAGLAADGHYSYLGAHCAADGGCSATGVPDAQARIDSGRPAGIASDVLLGVGLAAVAASAALFFLEGRHSLDKQTWKIAPTVDAHGAGLALEFVP